MIKNELPQTTLLTKDFYYDLPPEQIAQTPMTPRDHSRLMVLRHDGEIEHKHFYDIIDYLNKGDVLVINDSRVIPARIYGSKVRESEFVNEPSKIETLLPTNTLVREGNGTPHRYSCLENPMDGGAWWAAVCGVTKVGHD